MSEEATESPVQARGTFEAEIEELLSEAPRPRRRPLSPPVRGLAAAAWIWPFAMVLLAIPAYRQVRLVRLHCLLSLLLAGGSGLVFRLLAAIHPEEALEVLMLVGILLFILMVGYVGLAGWCAWQAYQGRVPELPLLSVAVKVLERRIAPIRRAP